MPSFQQMRGHALSPWRLGAIIVVLAQGAALHADQPEPLDIRATMLAAFEPLVQGKQVVGLAAGAIVGRDTTVIYLGSTGCSATPPARATRTSSRPPGPPGSLATRLPPAGSSERADSLESAASSEGSTSDEDKRPSSAADSPPDEQTLFEIGSITKTFTGLLLAEAVQRGEMDLDQPAQQVAPTGWQLPQGERPITLLDLATHTSGLPRLPDNLRPADWQDPYADYTPEQFASFLRSHALRREPGAAYEYSNVGAALLGQLLAHHAGVAYERLVTDRVLLPLGMTDTAITLSREQERRFAVGHAAAGQVQGAWRLGTFAGAGALRSNMHDMLQYLQAQLTPPPGLEAAILLSQRVRRDAHPGVQIGLGWHFDRPRKVWFHNGQTGGFHAMIVVDRAAQIGLVVLANSASEALDGPCFDLVGALQRSQLEAP